MLGAPATRLLCPSTSRILNPCGAKGATIPTTRTMSRTWTLTSGWATRRSELRLTTWRPPLSCIPGSSIKRIFPEYWPAVTGTHRTLLQYPHRTVPELCLAFPWCTAAWGTWHKSPGPIYPLGLDKTNFPRILNPRGANGQQYPQLALGPVPEIWLRNGITGSQNFV